MTNELPDDATGNPMTPDEVAATLALCDAFFGIFGMKRQDAIPVGQAVELDPDDVRLMDEAADWASYGGTD